MSKSSVKERPPLTFISFPPFILVQVHFPVHSPNDSSRISHVSRRRDARGNSRGMRRIDFSFFPLRFHESRESCILVHAIDPQQ